jgi:CDP-6-deoxy-D-xylo-4-hexulose-3-dehydrase
MKDAFSRHGIEYRPVVSGNLMIQPFLRNKYKIAIPKDGYLVDVVQKQGVYIGNNHFIGDGDMDFLASVVEEINDKFSTYN